MWALIKAKPGMTATAIINLERQSFVHYAPQFLEKRIRRGKSLTLTRYLFSTYIFVQMTNRWMALSNTYGVSRIILNDNRPEVVPQRIIDDLREREVDGFYQMLPSEFMPGQKVFVKDGLLTGKFGVCQGMRGPDRVKVLFQGLQVTMSVENLEAA